MRLPAPLSASLLVVLPLLLATASCSRNLPRLATAAGAELWQARQERLRALRFWELKGRVAARDGSEVANVRLSWEQRGADYRLRLSGPLGGNLHELTGNGRDGVTLRTADARVYHAETAEALMREHYGLNAPVAGLHYWVRGLPGPAPAPSDLVLDERGRLRSLRQAGWEIRFLDYAKRDGIELPVKLQLLRGEMRLRMVVHDWRLGGL
ncbi:MAG: lipoprotein insertase outer membrane protein LolB [Gammaproteobacteria bacterium]|nr:lipoprotein insertase outer membrane protein LolB [Gammaproteobacteria bacterium]